MKRLWISMAILMGCTTGHLDKTCAQGDEKICQAQRAQSNQTNFLITSFYFAKNNLNVASKDEVTLDALSQYQKSFNATFYLTGHSLDESESVQKNRLNSLAQILIKKGIPAGKIKTKVLNQPIYRNGQKNLNLSRRIDVYAQD